MKFPKRGSVFQVEMDDTKYMSVADKVSDTVRCISSKTKQQTGRSKRSITHVFSAGESQSMMMEFFEAPKREEQ
jgi:hypothetical protein